MRIVFDIGHPAQVHLFRHLITLLKSKGDEVLITSVDKDIALNLLNKYQLSYVNLGHTGSNVLQKVLSIPRLDWCFYKAVKDFNPDLLIGSASFRAAHISRLLKKPCFQMVDTEMGWKEHGVYLPFSDKIATPQCYRRNLGKKQVRYAGFQELAYLHPDQYCPDESILKFLDVSKRQFFILRFVAWKATHDMGHHGFRLEEKKILIEKLSKLGKVFITSEEPLPQEWESFAFPAPEHKFLDALSFARLVVTESNTVATEAALLGTPVVRYNSYVGEHDMGNFLELQKEYGLLFSSNDFSEAMQFVEEICGNPKAVVQWQTKRQRLLQEKVNTTQWMTAFIDEQWRHA